MLTLIIAILIIAFVLGLAKAVFKSAGEIAFIVVLVIGCYIGWQVFHSDIKHGAKNLTHEVVKSGENALDNVVESGKDRIKGAIQ